MPLNSLAWLDETLADAGKQVAPISKAIAKATQILNEAFTPEATADLLVRQKCRVIDRVLTHCFKQFLTHESQQQIALLAVGGYGRGELLPASDIDLLLLLARKPRGDEEKHIAQFLTFLWDIGLEVGSSVRTLRDCVNEGNRDITIMTNMIESRLITGDEAIYARFEKAISPKKMWSSKHFFEAKLEEQTARHKRYNDTAFNLEPNIKEGPGGLRDIQLIGWVAKRHFGARNLKELVKHEFLTAEEYKVLSEGQTHLWRIRFALHRLTGRREDRLLFDYQKQMAECFGYQGGPNNLAIEQFMQKYYRTVLELERLNEMLLQLLRQEILYKPLFNIKKKLNQDFILRNGYIEAENDKVFVNNPSALIQMFILMQERPDIRGTNAATIRLIRQSLYLIDDEFRSDPKNTELFMTFIRKPVGIIHQLRRMNRYGVLAAYIPEFARIVGRMQYDLFHAYTVDQHTLFVIRNLRRFSVEEWRHEFPLCNEIHDQLEKPELLYLAGLFHDIAKGRGGDHSELGARDAETFCHQHGMNAKDTRVVSQLVRMHLLMSTTAQRKDISDPEVVHDFAREVGSESMLDYLYLLTVADIRGTNPKQWNHWKDALLRELYHATRKVLRIGLDQPPDIDDIIRENREAACESIANSDFSREDIEKLCGEFPGDYFLHHKVEEVQWHVSSIIDNKDLETVVNIRQSMRARSTEIFVHTHNRRYLFARVVGVLTNLNMDILFADIYTTSDDYTLDTFIIHDRNGEPVEEDAEITIIRNKLLQALADPEPPKLQLNQRLPRILKSFSSPTEVSFLQDEDNSRTIMQLSTADRPGLLYAVAIMIAEANLEVTHAKITTLGERVEDIFYLTTKEGKSVTDPDLLESLRNHIETELTKGTNNPK
jgi:[protein-PII] uridylyltransferase